MQWCSIPRRRPAAFWRGSPRVGKRLRQSRPWYGGTRSSRDSLEREPNARGSDWLISRRVEDSEKRSPRYSLSETRRLIGSDIAFRCAYEGKPANWKTALRMLRHPGVACVVRYRLQCFFYSNRLAPLGWMMKFMNFIFYGVQIDERARIGAGLYMGHAASILITGNVSMGERCVLFHQNTIGLSPFSQREGGSGRVTVGNDVVFGGGACAYGDITIGDRCRIGVNTVVDRSFAADSSLFGVPAQVVGRQAER
jgi:serine O-acetyltransferase